MDTDDLTSMAYQCILYASEATDVLKAEFGAACSEFKTEDEYLLGLLKYIRGIERDPRAYLDDWNLLDDIDVKIFRMKLRNIREHLQKTLETRLEDRGSRPK